MFFHHVLAHFQTPGAFLNLLACLKSNDNKQKYLHGLFFVYIGRLLELYKRTKVNKNTLNNRFLFMKTSAEDGFL